MRHPILALFCIFIVTAATASAAVTVQITVFCNGGLSYDNAVTVTKLNPTALDAIKASGVGYTGYESSWGYYLTSIAGCGGDWGPAFYVNGGESSEGVSDYDLYDGDQLQFIGPNGAGKIAGILYLTHVPDEVAKGESFRVRAMERSVWSYGGYDRPSSGATVIVGHKSYTTGSDGFTSDITLETDAYYCVAAEKSGYVASYYFDGLPYIQVGVGGDYICSVTGEGGGRPYINFDEDSSVVGQGFSVCRCIYENPAGEFPDRSTKVYQKGSGNYSTDKIVRQRPSKIDVSESTEMKYNPTTFQANARALNYASKYEDSLVLKNYQTASQFREAYRQLDYIKRETSYNNSDKINFSLESDFKGIAELHERTLNQEDVWSGNRKAEPIEESYETYIGSFRIVRRGVIPILNTTSEEEDCEEKCNRKCLETCQDCYEYCSDICEEACKNETADEYEYLPCCTGGWSSMVDGDKVGYSGKGVFDCSCNKNALQPVGLGQKA
ncbi:MAG: hypothetical protein HPY61_06775 [Methanotrichaceae archaeon]|nr:hypothetical protein [Methanotrichaceae archaeon]